ncbi:hypothetical protein D3C81_2166180 [compost metagenome]
MGGILYGLLDAGVSPDKLQAEELLRIIRFGNAAGSLAATSGGGIPSMPDESRILHLLSL